MTPSWSKMILMIGSELAACEVLRIASHVECDYSIEKQAQLQLPGNAQLAQN